MKKIPCLFQRDFTDRRKPVLLRAVTPGCEWVLAGEGIATRKWDGTAVAIIGGKLYARYDAKKGKEPPIGAIPCDAPDPITGHHPHWVLADRSDDKYLREAFSNFTPRPFEGLAASPDSCVTYEAVGPWINGNHERLLNHMLLRHGAVVLVVERDYDWLFNYFQRVYMEGIVFHHPDGRMCKIRRADYGLPWPDKSQA